MPPKAWPEVGSNRLDSEEKIMSLHLFAKLGIASITAIAVAGALTGCTTSTSSTDREAAANPDMPTVCFASIGEESIEVEWNVGRSESEVHVIQPQHSWCAEKPSQSFTFTSRAGIRWTDGSPQLIVEAGTGYQGLFARYLDTSKGIDQWVNMPFYDDSGDGGDNRIGDHRIITHSYKRGTKDKFILFNVQSM